jgi:hypothetical protein
MREPLPERDRSGIFLAAAAICTSTNIFVRPPYVYRTGRWRAKARAFVSARGPDHGRHSPAVRTGSTECLSDLQNSISMAPERHGPLWCREHRSSLTAADAPPQRVSHMRRTVHRRPMSVSSPSETVGKVLAPSVRGHTHSCSQVGRWPRHLLANNLFGHMPHVL